MYIELDSVPHKLPELGPNRRHIRTIFANDLVSTFRRLAL